MCSVALVVSDSVTLWTVAHQAHQSTGFSRQEYWSELPCPSPGDLPNPVIKPASPAFQADSLLTELPVVGGLVAKSCLTLETPGTVARQAPPSLGFSRQEHWSGLPLPSPMHGSEK